MKSPRLGFAFAVITCAAMLLLHGCGGGPSAPPVPTASLSASANSVSAGATLTLSWSSTNATSCTASSTPSENDWSGSKSVSGSQIVIPTVTGTTKYALSCDGSGGSASSSASVQVSPAQPLLITTGSLPSGTMNTAYAGNGVQLTASGGIGTYTWSWSAATGSTLPPGLALAGDTISGVPTSAGTFNVVVSVKDSQSPPAQTSTPFTITIGSISIISGNPPDGVAGSVYNLSHTLCHTSAGYVPCGGFPLLASGGVPPYTWSWAAAPGSSTPPGLNVLPTGRCPVPFIFSNWKIACVPTTAGTYNVIVTAADSATPPNHVSANYTITITNPPPPSIKTNPPPSEGAINLPYSFKFTAAAGLSPLTWSETGALPPGLSLATDGTLSGTPTALGSFPITVMVVDSLSRSATPVDFTIVIAAHGFKATGSMSLPRVFHTSTLLPDGRVLVAGGSNKIAFNVPTTGTRRVYSSTEIYDPATASFALAASMSNVRANHTATLLNDGKVLIAGGYDGNIAPLNTAELYDPVSNTFSPTSGNMTSPRSGHQATLLSDGRVLIAGGFDGTGALASAEIFDPSSGVFTATGSMHSPRLTFTQTTMKEGTVLVAGPEGNTSQTVGTAEIFNPANNSFSAPINMTVPHEDHTATLLNSGKVFLAGGTDGVKWFTSTEIFDPSAGTFSSGGDMASARAFHVAALLNDGTVLLAGGRTSAPPTLALAELFDPVSKTFTGTGSLFTSRAEHTVTLLNDGRVLVTGGEHDPGTGITGITVLASAEIYQ